MEFFAASGVDKRCLFGGTDHWIEIKQELTAGESRRLAQSGVRRMSRAVHADETLGDLGMELDLEGAAFTKVALYLVDWNIPGPDGKTVDITGSREKVDALRALKPAVFSEIERVIDQEVLARIEKKVAVTGTPISASSNVS